jgi:hypothetical protein
VDWCESLLALPEKAMSTTRRRTRADLACLFDDFEKELEDVTAHWWSDEAQTVLRTLAARLTKKT